MFTVFSARIFIKEPIVVADILNVILVFFGILLIVKPPFIFGMSEMYTSDPEAIYAALALILAAIFMQANVYVILRQLKGKWYSKNLSKLVN